MRNLLLRTDADIFLLAVKIHYWQARVVQWKSHRILLPISDRQI
jgi:hypothetical protein